MLFDAVIIHIFIVLLQICERDFPLESKLPNLARMKSGGAATGIEPETITLTYAYYMLLIFIAYKFYRNLPEFYDSSW